MSEGWIQPRLNDARWTMNARERLQRLSWFMHRLKEPLSLGRQGRHPRRPRDRRGQADRLSACRSGITGSTRPRPIGDVEIWSNQTRQSGNYWNLYDVVHHPRQIEADPRQLL